MDNKNKRHCPPFCPDHQFYIQHPHKTRYNAAVTFCPKFHREPRQPETTYPIFNEDTKYYTSAFILGVDARNLQQNDLQQLADHNKHMKDMLEKKGKIAFPKPNKRHTLCAVCRQKYSNYYHHIMSQEHKRKINANTFNDYILELQDRYKELHITQAPEPLELVDIHKEQQQDEPSMKAESNQELLNIANKTQTLPSDIVPYIISSRQSFSESESSSPENRYKQKNKKIESSSDSQSSSQSESSSSPEGNTTKERQQINLDSSSDSVQIIGVTKGSDKCEKKPSKKPQRKGKEAQDKQQKREKKEKKKHKSRAIDLQKKKKQDAKKKKVDKNQFDNRPARTLIEKPQIHDPQPELSMQKILDNIVGTVGNNKYRNSKPNELNLFEKYKKQIPTIQLDNGSQQTKPLKTAQVAPPPPKDQKPFVLSSTQRPKIGFDSPFAPPKLKQMKMQEQQQKIAQTEPKIHSPKPINSVNQKSQNIQDNTADKLPKQSTKPSKAIQITDTKTDIDKKTVNISNKGSDRDRQYKSERPPMKRAPPFDLPQQQKTRRYFAPNRQLKYRKDHPIAIDQDEGDKLEVMQRKDNKKSQEMRMINFYQSRALNQYEINNDIIPQISMTQYTRPTQSKQNTQKAPKNYFSQQMFGSLSMTANEISPPLMPKMGPSLPSTNETALADDLHQFSLEQMGIYANTAVGEILNRQTVI